MSIAQRRRRGSSWIAGRRRGRAPISTGVDPKAGSDSALRPITSKSRVCHSASELGGLGCLSRMIRVEGRDVRSKAVTVRVARGNYPGRGDDGRRADALAGRAQGQVHLTNALP